MKICCTFPKPVRTEFTLPEEQIPVAILVMGHPAEGDRPSRLHADNTPLEYTVTYR